jgi:hypothetical protein
MTKFGPWIFHAGGPRPVGEDVWVQVWHRGDVLAVAEKQCARPAKLFHWLHRGRIGDIIACRIVEEADTPLPIPDEFWRLVPHIAGAAMDKDGEVWAFADAPMKSDSSWQLYSIGGGSMLLANVDTTDIIWDRSWTPNPHYEGDE